MGIKYDDTTKILLATGVQISGTSGVLVLDFLQSSYEAKSEHMNVIARIAVTPKTLREYIKMFQETLRRVEALKSQEDDNT